VNYLEILCTNRFKSPQLGKRIMSQGSSLTRLLSSGRVTKEEDENLYLPINTKTTFIEKQNRSLEADY
jgi:hypothetical protein